METTEWENSLLLRETPFDTFPLWRILRLIKTEHKGTQQAAGLPPVTDTGACSRQRAEIIARPCSRLCGPQALLMLDCTEKTGRMAEEWSVLGDRATTAVPPCCCARPQWQQTKGCYLYWMELFIEAQNPTRIDCFPNTGRAVPSKLHCGYNCARAV